MTEQFKPDDTVVWWKSLPGGDYVYPVKAKVVGLTAKRVKIEAEDEGQIVIRHVKPESLQLHGRTSMGGHNSLRALVGPETYAVWTDMLHSLVPEGRTHRLAPWVAGMLQYAASKAYEKYGDGPEDSVAQTLLHASEVYDTQDAEELLELVKTFFEDAGVGYERADHQGVEYNVVESAIYEFIHWYDMPGKA